MIRVLHADDSSAYRLLVRELLAGEEGIELVGAAGEPEELLATLADREADVVLLDLMQGSELLHGVRRAAPDARIVLLTGMPRSAVPAEVHQAADAYVQKSAPFGELVRVVRGVTGHQ